MLFDRAAILRQAHASARWRTAPSPTFRVGDRWCDTAGGYVPKQSYREVFAFALRWAWRDAKVAAEDAAYEASLPPLPADITDRIRELREEAWASPITRLGNDHYAALLAQAHDLRDAARAIVF